MSHNATEKSPILRLSQINKSYLIGQETLQVLAEINLNVYQGDFVAILGPSGSGKSTLMNIIGCMDTCDSGEYYLKNIAVHQANDAQQTQIRNEQIGFIFQKYHLISKYNVLQNVLLPLLMRGVPRASAIALATEKLTMLGLENRLNHKPNELSGGQQQRVSIARALVGQPALLLADEPTGALDSKTGDDVLALFKQLHQAGHTIMMITHDHHVGSQASTLLNMVDGRLYAG